MARRQTVFHVTGDRQVQRNLQRIARQTGDGMLRGVRVEAERIMTRSKQEFVPVDRGPLRSSGHVSDAIRRGKEIRVVMSFGGPAGSGNVGGETNREKIGYAIVQHEVKLNHPGQGTWKYLEKPLREALPDLPRRISTHIDLR